MVCYKEEVERFLLNMIIILVISFVTHYCLFCLPDGIRQHIINVLYEKKRMVWLGPSYEEVCSTNSLRNIMYDKEVSFLQPEVEFYLCTSTIS